MLSPRLHKQLKCLLTGIDTGGVLAAGGESRSDKVRRRQAANVHAVLEGGGVVAGVLQRAADAGRAVEDLAESLTIFDLKLRHMREARAHAALASSCGP